MLPTVTGLPFAVQLKALTDQEFRYQPKLSGLRIIETAHDNGLRMTARLREYEVKDLLSLTRFFGFSAETFSLAVNLLDRFLAVMKIQPKHLSCVGLSCFYIAVKTSEEGKNVPMANELIRISQNRFTVSDMMRMEKIILEKLYWKVKAPTALHFLRLFYSCIQDMLEDEWYDDCRLGRYTVKDILNIERLEAQLKACHCSFTFSKVKPSLLALSLLALELQEQHDHEHVDKLLNAFKSLQQQLTVREGDLVIVTELVMKCLIEYSTTRVSRPNSQRLRWILSGRTQRTLKHSYYKIAHMPTIPESAY
uniref:Cyclin-like domain-containing protein n=1 Tax=Oncorhynchus tshawytscha TaxID=74940 RepID=A0A8C8F3H2_ONCTS